MGCNRGLNIVRRVHTLGSNTNSSYRRVTLFRRCRRRRDATEEGGSKGATIPELTPLLTRTHLLLASHPGAKSCSHYYVPEIGFFGGLLLRQYLDSNSFGGHTRSLMVDGRMGRIAPEPPTGLLSGGRSMWATPSESRETNWAEKP